VTGVKAAPQARLPPPLLNRLPAPRSYHQPPHDGSRRQAGSRYRRLAEALL
ncbi:unnamed protein product, partial [Musa banksii]